MTVQLRSMKRCKKIALRLKPVPLNDEVIPELNQSDGDEEELPIWMRFLDADAGDDETDQTHPPSEAIPDHGQTPDDSFEEPLIQRFQQEESEEESWEPEENPDTSSRNLLTDASKELLDRMGAHADLSSARTLIQQ